MGQSEAGVVYTYTLTWDEFNNMTSSALFMERNCRPLPRSDLDATTALGTCRLSPFPLEFVPGFFPGKKCMNGDEVLQVF